MPEFHGIKIEATGQNIITLGDGNQINAKFSDLGKTLSELREAVGGFRVAKMEIVADIETIQSQLAKPEPTQGMVTIFDGWSDRRRSVKFQAVNLNEPLRDSKGMPLRPLPAAIAADNVHLADAGIAGQIRRAWPKLFLPNICPAPISAVAPA